MAYRDRDCNETSLTSLYPTPINGALLRTQFNYRANYSTSVAILQAIAANQINIVAYVRDGNSTTLVVGPGGSYSAVGDTGVEFILRRFNICFCRRIVVQILQVPPIPGGLAALSTALFDARIPTIQSYFGETGNPAATTQTISIFFRVPTACAPRAQLVLGQVGNTAPT